MAELEEFEKSLDNYVYTHVEQSGGKDHFSGLTTEVDGQLYAIVRSNAPHSRLPSGGYVEDIAKHVRREMKDGKHASFSYEAGPVEYPFRGLHTEAGYSITRLRKLR